MTFDTVTFDPLGWWDAANNRWNPKQAGKYHFSAVHSFAYVPTGSPTNDSISLKLKLNGSTLIGADVRTELVATGTGGFPLVSIISMSTDYAMNGSTDYVELYATSSRGGTNAGQGHHMSAFRISA